MDGAWSVSSVKIVSFKSFGSEETEWNDWPQGLIGIVGANGAGKSCLLEAVAFCCGASASHLRVKQFSDLQHHSNLAQHCKEPTSVEIEINSTKRGARDSITHKIRCQLSSDGSRSYSIDSRGRTVTQVKKFLRERGIMLESAFIRQAQVANLAEASPEQLAQTLSNASGLARWEQETRAAADELTKTRQALDEIHANVTQLQERIRQSGHDLDEASRLQNLELEIEECSKLAMTRWKNLELLCTESLEWCQKYHTWVQDSRQTCTESAIAIQKEISTLQTSCRCNDGFDGQSAIASAARAISSLEEQVKQCRVELQRASACELQIKELQSRKLHLKEVSLQQLNQLNNMRSSMAQLLSVMGMGQASGKSVVQQLKSLHQQAELKHQEQEELHKIELNARLLLENEIKKCESDLERATVVHQAAVKAREDMHRTQPSLSKALPLKQSMHRAAVSKVSDLEVQLKISEQILARRSRILHMCDMSASMENKKMVQGSMHGPQPLHQCFNFKLRSASEVVSGISTTISDSDLEKLVTTWKSDTVPFLKPLAKIAGDKLDVVVCSTSKQASSILAGLSHKQGSLENGPSRIRLWPLEKLTHKGDLMAKRAQAICKQGEIWIPAQLMQYPLELEAAILRAFSSYIIAKDERTAAMLAQHNVSCVTLSGLISSRGIVSGGSQDVGQPSRFEQLLRERFDIDCLKESLSYYMALCDQLKKEISLLEAFQTYYEDAIHSEQTSRTRIATLTSQKTDLEDQFNILQGRLTAQSKAKDSAAEEILLYSDALAKNEADTSNQESSRKGAAQVEVELSSFESKISDLEKEHESTLDNLETVQLELEALQTRVEDEELVLCEAAEISTRDTKGAESQQGDTGLVEMQQQKLQRKLSELHAEKMKMEEAEIHILDGRRRREGLEERMRKMEETLSEENIKANMLQRKMHEIEGYSKNLTACHGRARRAVLDLDQQYPGLLLSKNVSTLAITPPVVSPNNVLEECNKQHIQSLMKFARQAEEMAIKQQAVLEDSLMKKSRLNIKKGSVAERVLYEEWVSSAKLFLERAELVTVAANTLEEGIAESRQQVLSTNEDVLLVISDRFQQLCAALLPSMEFQLVKTGTCASEGLNILFRPAGQDAQDCKPPAWSNLLEQLSGGQRTLVSLALLISVAQCGQRSSIFLLDEVDAALDEHNQAAMAGLLHMLTKEGGIQILCVSHNAAFQRFCNLLIHVSPHEKKDTKPSTQKNQTQTSKGKIEASKKRKK